MGESVRVAVLFRRLHTSQVLSVLLRSLDIGVNLRAGLKRKAAAWQHLVARSAAQVDVAVHVFEADDFGYVRRRR